MSTTKPLETARDRTVTRERPGREARGAAFFDLDGTLIPGSANVPLAMAAFRSGIVTTSELARDLHHGLSFLLTGASDARSAEVRDRILRGVAGRPASQVEALADGFMARLVASLQPELLVVLDDHAAAGRDRVVLSASPTEIVSRFAREAGLEYGTGTTSERDSEGVYTGRLSGPFCYREGKAEVLRIVAEDRGYDLAASYAYSDSVSDLPMLRAVGIPVAVNPDPALRRIASDEGWTIIETAAMRRVSLTSPTGLARLTVRLAARLAGRAAVTSVTSVGRGVSRAIAIR